MTSNHCRKVPNLLKKINKALGLPKTSEKLWDILLISQVEENVADLNDGLNNVCTFYATHSVIHPNLY